MTNNQFLDRRNEPRVVITGMGALTPIGLSIAESWESIMIGRSGIDRVTQFDASVMSCQIGGEVTGFDPHDYLPRKKARKMARSSQLAYASATTALADAGFANGGYDPERMGVCLGTAIGGFEMADNNMVAHRRGGWKQVKPFGLIGCLPNMMSHHVGMLAKCYGPTTAIAAACASGTQAIGEAVEYIRRGRADIMITGGVDGLIHESSFTGFCAMKAMPTEFNDNPTQASRPFDKNRRGFLLSEGSGTFILERLDQALARGAHIHAEIIGHANSAEAYHMATPAPDGSGRMRAMKWAIQDAGIEPDQVDYINAHGTSTPLNDAAETLAIKKLFGEQAYKIPVSSTKALTGHALGGAGAIEASFAIKTLQTGILPPTWNYETPDPACDLDYVTEGPRKKEVTHVLSNSFGLGGQNACIVLKKYDPAKA